MSAAGVRMVELYRLLDELPRDARRLNLGLYNRGHDVSVRQTQRDLIALEAAGLARSDDKNPKAWRRAC